MNVVILTGNITKDPELKMTAKGTSVVSACIAVSRDIKNLNGEYVTDFINFTAWDKQADYLAQYAKKGDRLELRGRWETRDYEDRDGKMRIVHEMQVERLSVFSRQPKDITQKPELIPVHDDDLPF